MKRLVNILTIILLTGMQVSAQCVERTTTTDPDVTGGYDWRGDKLAETVWIGNAGWTNVKGVFNSPQNANLGYLAALPKDMKPEDGWELIYVNIGEDPSGPNGNDLNHPVLVLYNKYRSVMRVFVCITGTNSDYNKSTVFLSWDEFANGTDTASANLSAYNSPMDALDKFNETKAVIELKKFNQWSNNGANPGGYYWLMGEFPVMYDPCVCNYNSSMNVGAILTNQGDLQFNVFEQQEKGAKTASSGSANSSSKGFARALGYAGTAVKKGNEYKKTLGEVGTALEDMFGTVTAISNAISGDSTPFKFPAWTKQIPKVGVIIGVAEFLVSGGNKSAGSATQTTVKIPNLRADGDLEFSATFAQQKFNTPGADHTGESAEYLPHYDNPLGIFNLLETPELEFVEYFLDAGQAAGTFDPLLQKTVWHFPRLRQYRVKNDLKYVVNPHAGLELVDIQAKISFTMGGEFTRVGGESGINSAKQWDVQNDLPPKKGGLNKSVQYGPYGPAIIGVDTNVDMRDKWRRAGITLDFKSDSFPGVNRYVFGTTWSPLGCFPGTTFMLTKYSTGFYKNDPLVTCKIRAVFKRTDDPDAKEVIWTGTFDTKISQSSLQDNTNNRYALTSFDQFGSPVAFNPHFSDISQKYQINYIMGGINSGNRPNKTVWPIANEGKPENLVFANMHIPAGNYFATNKITIGPNVTMDEGIVFRAGKKIDVLENVDIPINVDLDISDKWHPNCDRPVNTVNQSAIDAFCANATKYKPQYVKSKRELVDSSSQAIKTKVEEITFKVYPNPTNGKYSVSFNSSLDDIELAIFDLSGKIVYKRSYDAASSLIELDATALTSGIYFINIKTNDGHIGREKLVKY